MKREQLTTLFDRVVADQGLAFYSGDENEMDCTVRTYPAALAQLSRRSTTHRRIINDKADYISGKGFSLDHENHALARIVECANGAGARQL